MKYRSQRYPTRYSGDVEIESRKQDCVVLSISTSGASLTMDRAPEVGAIVSLDHPGGRVDATVKWVREGNVGIAFETELSTHMVDRLRFGLQASVSHRSQNRGHFTEMR